MFSDAVLPSLFASELSTVGVVGAGCAVGAALALIVAQREWLRPFKVFFFVMAAVFAVCALKYGLVFIVRAPWWASLLCVAALVPLGFLLRWNRRLGQEERRRIWGSASEVSLTWRDW